MTPIATILPMTILRIEWHDQCVSTSIPILLTSRMTQFEKSKRKKIRDKVFAQNRWWIIHNWLTFLHFFDLIFIWMRFLIFVDDLSKQLKCIFRIFLKIEICYIVTRRKANPYQQTRTCEQMAFTFVWVSIRIWMRLDHF